MKRIIARKPVRSACSQSDVTPLVGGVLGVVRASPKRAREVAGAEVAVADVAVSDELAPASTPLRTLPMEAQSATDAKPAPKRKGGK
jgi:hypothetical protein